MKERIEYFELGKLTVLKAVSNCINELILMDYELVNIIPDGDKYILKWEKRLKPLSIEEIGELHK